MLCVGFSLHVRLCRMADFKYDIVTTNPIAIQRGQTDFHVRHTGGPWHLKTYVLPCPECGAEYIVDEAFLESAVKEMLRDDHRQGNDHQIYIPAFSEKLRVVRCACR
jgi:hypothetical protein